MTLSERTYQALLVVYPSEHRRAYGDPMVQLFRDRMRRDGGGLRTLTVWTQMGFDLAAMLPTVRKIVAPIRWLFLIPSPARRRMASTKPTAIAQPSSSAFTNVNPNTTLFTASSTTEVSHQRPLQFLNAMIVSIRSLNADAARSKPI